jgi:E3 ubiquitin-protein ligase BRE1
MGKANRNNAHLSVFQAFRKEALYRRMRHYARELERTQATADEFEKRKNVCEAGMAAMEACWNQVGIYLFILFRPNLQCMLRLIRSY